jgi:Holliday junction DNA helicase RuvA
VYDHLRGELIERHAARVVLRAGGVGFDVKVPAGTLARATPGETVTLHVLLHVVDGAPTLLGFATQQERDVARKLLGVAGVGPAMTIAILSTFAPRELAAALRADDVTALKRIKGVGNKTAERLCVELRDQLDALAEAGAPSAVTLEPKTSEDAVIALVTLGYGEKEARERVRKAHAATPGASTEDMVKAVLRGA